MARVRNASKSDARVGLARTICIRGLYDIFGRDITKCTVIYGAYMRFWPTLKSHACNASKRDGGCFEHIDELNTVQLVKNQGSTGTQIVSNEGHLSFLLGGD